MTRIGFAYNQKPDTIAGFDTVQADGSRPDEEPPSNRRDIMSRNLQAPASALTGAHGRAAATLDVSDQYAEWDSPETIEAVADALSAYGDVVLLEATADFPARLVDDAPDIVFNIAEGLAGMNREAHVPAICEFFGIPSSGSDPFTLSLCLNKARTKEVLSYHGIPTARFALVRSVGEMDSVVRGRTFPLPPPSAQAPLFVKPVQEGSSKGITERNLVRSREELDDQVANLLEAYDQPVLVEEFLPGAEFTCGVLGNGATARVLPIVGMNFEALPDGALPIYGFEAKWIWDHPDAPLAIFECPAPVTDRLRRAIEEVTLRTYRVLGCRDWARVDVRLDGRGVPNVVEVNPLPGILPDPADNSCLPKAARAAGISYDGLIQTCLAHAADRTGVPLTRRGVTP